jgi:DNA-binding winged helix-turn-helix (wHTH) protein/tetratricopeptide (TPR) repeat protein
VTDDGRAERESLRIGAWDVDADARQLTRAGEMRRLEPRVMTLLLRLADEPGRVVSRSELLADVWGDAYVGDDAVSAAVIKLRKAFGDDARSPFVIETVAKSGYRLVAAVERAPIGEPDDDTSSTPDSPTVRTTTVLRCAIDVRGRAGAAADAEEWQRAAQECTERCTHIARARGGWVMAETSGIVVLFGAPEAQEHHAARAIRAAVEIRESEKRHESSAEGVNVGVRIGIASGDVVTAATVGAPAPVPVHGAPIQLASELAEAAVPGEILVTDETLLLSQGVWRAQPHDRPEKLSIATNVFHLEETGEWGTAWDERRRRGLTPLRGRDYEMARISALLDLATTGEGQLLTLSGEPGVGKSRLLHELLTIASDRGFATRVGNASPLGQHSPFLPFEAMLRQAHRIESRGETGSATDGEALTAMLEPGGGDLAWQATDPEVRHARIVATAFDVLLDDTAPVVLAIEDLQWADEASRTLIGALVDRIARRRCLLVLSWRPEFTDPWASKSYATRLRIDPLDSTAAAAMLDELVGSDPSLVQWKTQLLERADGTPLFVEESVRTAADRGTLEGAPGHFTMHAGTPFESLPPSVHGLLAERIDRLSPPAQSALSLAAILGREVPAPLLHGMLEAGDDDRELWLGELQAAEMLYATGTREQPSYIFKHAFTQEAAYRRIPPTSRRDHHRRAAALLETELSGVPRTPEMLAHHLGEAGLDERALDEWRRAADVAAQSGAFTDAMRHLERARGLLAAVADEQPRNRHELGIELATGAALIQTIGPTEPAVEQAYRHASALAASVGTPTQRFEAEWGLWFVAMMRGDIHDARMLGDELSARADVLDDDALELEAHHVQWSGLALAGELSAALEHTEIGLDRYRTADHHWLTFSFGGHDPGVCARNLNAMARWLRGDLDSAREKARSAIALADELRHPYTQLEARFAALNISLLDRDADGLEHQARIVQGMVQADRLPEVAHGYAAGYLGVAAAIRGDHATAFEMLSTASPVWQEFWGAWCFPLDAAFAQELAASGATTEAIRNLENKLASAHETGANWWNAEFLRVLAGLRLQVGDVDAARSTFHEALETARSQQARFLELRAATDLARLEAATESETEAITALRAVVESFAPGLEAAALSDARSVLSGGS